MKLSEVAIRIPESDRYGAYILDAIREGMAPFRMKQIYCYMEHDFGPNEYVITGAAVLMSGYTISFSSRMSATTFVDNLYVETRRISEEMLIMFRDRPDRLLAPLIYLGEN